jgi:hypothetical protein
MHSSVTVRAKSNCIFNDVGPSFGQVSNVMTFQEWTFPCLEGRSSPAEITEAARQSFGPSTDIRASLILGDTDNTLLGSSVRLKLE